ncbi:MAG TPA: ATP phosphoribosyltransferase [Nitrospirales bacterium]|jgi:ATP phosphoribosyltransferase|nr:ATP phosphoribosyltransferase [Nitrospirales bacterium]
MNDILTVALSKGKLLEPAIDLFKRVGLAPKDISADSRRLVFEHQASGTTLMIIRPSDVPTYVEYGAVDVGVVGADVLMEQATDVYEPLDLGFGACRLAVAAPESAVERNGRHGIRLRVATKYPNMTERFFTQKGIPIEIIKLYGSVELAPLVGLADRIVDLVSSGKTLRAHNLVVTDVIAESTARLIVNRASLKLKHKRVNGLIEALRTGLQGGRS